MNPIFYEYEDKGTRRTSLVAFLCITLFFLAAFTIIPMPTQEEVERRVETIMLDQAVFEILDNPATAVDEGSSEDLVDVGSDESISSEDSESVTEDLEALMETFGGFDFSEVEWDNLVTTQGSRNAVPSTLEEGELEIETGDIAEVFGNRSLDLTSDLVQREESRSQTTRTLRSSLLSESVSAEGRPGGRRISGSGIGGDTGLDLRSRAPGSSDLLRSNREEIKQEQREIQFTVPVDKLAEWIRQNQSPVDPGIRSLFRVAPTDLTAKVPISVQGHAFGLQLSYLLGPGEVHIALIDRETIYYFIDPGSQRRANYFQKGTVRLNTESMVMLVESEDFSPRGPEAHRFFEVFLTWWSEVEADL